VIKVPSFSKNAASEVKEACTALIEQGAQALVIDLRGNVGGYFPAGLRLPLPLPLPLPLALPLPSSSLCIHAVMRVESLTCVL